MKRTSLSIKAKDQFLALCDQGVFAPGDKIPSESEMSRRFGISRETWRSSLEQLRREGVLYSKHGAGTFLLESTHKIENDLSELRSLSEMIRNAGIVESAPEIRVTDELPSDEVIEMLRVPQDEPVCVIRRTRFSDSSAICFNVNYIPIFLADEINRSTPPTSIFDYFEREKGIVVTRSTTRIFVPDSTDPLLSEIRKNKNVSILGLKQLHFDARGNTAMFSIDYLRCDLFNFSITRIRPR